MKGRASKLSLLSSILLCCALLIAPVLADNPYQYESLVIEQNISNSLQIIPLQSNYDVAYIDITLELFPQESKRQKVLARSFIPQPQEEREDAVLFSWQKPTEQYVAFHASAKVKTSGDSVKISRKIPFPLQDIPLQLQPYLQETAYIDSNSQIRHTAYSLANDIDDLFAVEVAFAEWVNSNIAYNLSTLTSETNKPSSWVYENRYGVCDEITNLFISFNRAVGIPARFVSGIAYSEMVKGNWGNHGWAEVYFPDIGWVPFDVTYEQFGFVDATHVELSKHVDGTHPSVHYATRGKYFDFEPEQLNFSTAILAKGEVLKEQTNAVLGVQEAIVGPGSYNLIIATIKNPHAYYVVEEVHLAKTEGLTMFDELKKRVLLAPFEEKNLYWLVKVDEGLSKNYVYTFPVSGTLTHKTTIQNSFVVEQSGEQFSKTYMKQFLTPQKEKEMVILCEHDEKIIANKTLQTTCFFSKEAFPVTLCLENNCQIIQSKEESVTLPLDTSTVGVHTVIVQTKDKKYQTFVTYRVEDTATLSLANISLPTKISFDEQARLSFTINKESLANPSNVSVSVSNGLIAESWDFLSFNENKQFNVLIDGETLAVGRNNFIISLEYTTNLGTKQHIEQIVSTTMQTTNNRQKLLGLLNRFSLHLNKLGEQVNQNVFHSTSKQTQRFIVLVITFLVFILIIGLITGVSRKIRRMLEKRTN